MTRSRARLPQPRAAATPPRRLLPLGAVELEQTMARCLAAVAIVYESDLGEVRLGGGDRLWTYNAGAAAELPLVGLSAGSGEEDTGGLERRHANAAAEAPGSRSRSEAGELGPAVKGSHGIDLPDPSSPGGPSVKAGW